MARKKHPEALPPIVQDYVRYMQRWKDKKFSVETRRRNYRKAQEAYSVMTAQAQRQALTFGLE